MFKPMKASTDAPDVRHLHSIGPSVVQVRSGENGKGSYDSYFDVFKSNVLPTRVSRTLCIFNDGNSKHPLMICLQRR